MANQPLATAPILCYFSRMSRDAILAKVKKATEVISEKAAYPAYETTQLHSTPRLAGADLWETFSRNFRAVNGKCMRQISELVTFLKDSKQTVGYCDPLLWDSIGKPLADAGLTVDTTYDRAQYDRYQFGITRATGAIAESGTLILDDEQTSDRLAALSPWTHVAVFTEQKILRTITDAIAALGTAPNVIWATGPSKTADVEGILIEGVHGPGEQIALCL
jgi:L-lactate dehydrogenase complex protein LldG